MKEAGSPPPPRTPLANIDAHPEVASHKEEPDRPQKRRGLVFWIVIGLVGFLIIAIALGVGLGVGLTRHKSSKSSSSRCGSFRMGLWNHCSPYQVLLHHQQTLRRMHYLMEFTTTRRYQLWHWEMVTNGYCSKREPGTFEKRSSLSQRTCGQVTSTILWRQMREIIHRWQPCL